jgi:hypothetical protein
LNATGQTAGGFIAFVGKDGWDGELALVLLGLVLKSEDRAGFDHAGQVGALVDGSLEDLAFPTIHEVGVVSMAGGITIGPDEFTSLTAESKGVPDRLEEEGDQANGVSRGAVAVISQVRIGHVRFVVRGVQVLSVPAGWEEDLGAETVGAGVIKEVFRGHAVAVHGTLGGSSVVQAVESERILHEFTLIGGGRLGSVSDGAVALVGIASKDAQAFGESLDIVTAREVVATAGERVSW